MSRHEITFAQYDAFTKAKGLDLPKDLDWGREDRPVIYVDWKQARAYSRWLSDQVNMSCDLPSEAQWEYAARAGTTTFYALPTPNGSDDIRDKGLANCNGCGSQWDGKKTAPVGSFKPNAWGLYDMHGNLLEWTRDCWHKNYQGAPSDGSAWGEDNGGECKYRVLRGGSWLGIPVGARSADRIRDFPGIRHISVGFRVLCSGPLLNTETAAQRRL
jgi:formylglycine-generating enzyme required for sulfatase activity